jgi:hypothetical protein
MSILSLFEKREQIRKEIDCDQKNTGQPLKGLDDKREREIGSLLNREYPR